MQGNYTPSRHRITLALLAAMLGTALAACSPDGRTEATAPDTVHSGSAVPIADTECRAVTSLEVVHRVNGAQVTDTVRLTDEANRDPGLALQSFQALVDHYGA